MLFFLFVGAGAKIFRRANHLWGGTNELLFATVTNYTGLQEHLNTAAAIAVGGGTVAMALFVAYNGGCVCPRLFVA